MMRSILILVAVLALTSCGSDKKEESSEKITEKNPVNYSLEIDAIYEKDDSVTVVYQLDNVMQYEKAIRQKVQGSPMPQKILFNFPEGEYPENFNITVSANKDQAYVTIKNVSIKFGDKTVDGSNYKFIEYFMTDSSFSWDLEKSRYNLNHTNQYPPALVGNENLFSLMIQ